jgi:predicted DNA-binding protein
VRAPRTNPIVCNPRTSRRNVAAWVERQVHDEFQILCHARGITKSEYVREFIEREVQAHLKDTTLIGA